MSADQAIFERHEKKNILSHSQYQLLRNALKDRMQDDEFGLYCTCSLYYDTDDYDLIRHCNSKPIYKEKLRLRSYGVPTQEQTVFIELKKKYKGITYKRRLPLSYKEAWRYLNHGIKPEVGGQILNEIDWFIHRNHVKPAILLCYDRIALCGKEDNEFRMTFDFNIRWRDDNFDISKGSYGTPLLEKDSVLMEVKTLKSLPCWFTSILSEFKIYPNSFSKYGNVYKNYLLKNYLLELEGEGLRNVE